MLVLVMYSLLSIVARHGCLNRRARETLVL